MVAGGAWFTWPSPLLPRLLSIDSPVPMTREQVAWMVSCIEVGSLLGSLPAFLIADYCGRKFCMLIVTPGYLVGVVLTVYVKNVVALCVARVMEGLSISIAYTVLPIYLGEIASPEVRGALTGMFHIAWSVGCLIPYCVGPFLSYDLFTYFTLSITVFFVLCFSWQPETPYFYAKTGDTKEASRMLMRLRDVSSPEEVQEELNEIQLEVKKALERKTNFKDVVATPADRRALLLIIIVGIVSFLSGQNVILTYTTDTFSQFPSNLLTPDEVTVGIGIVAIVGSVFTIFTSDSFGRRFLLLFSATGCMLSLLVTSAYFYMYSNTSIDVAPYSWVAALSVMSYNLFVTAGMHPVCVTYTSELFPTNTRGIASSISNLNLTLCSFIVLKFYDSLSLSFGTYFPFSVFTLICFIGVVLFYFMMPETKGKTFLEIKEMLANKSLS